MTLTNATITGAWSLQQKNTSLQGRLMLGAFMYQQNPGGANTVPLNTWRSGVYPSSSGSGIFFDLKVSQAATPSLSLSINAGSFLVSRASQGPYEGWSAGVTTVTTADADPTNPRLDLIVARVEDTGVGDGFTRGQIQVITGTPAGSPVIPALPAGAIPLASARVNALATTITSANITDLRESAGVLGTTRRLLPGDLLTDPGWYDGELRDTGSTIDRWVDSSSSWANVKVLGSTGCRYQCQTTTQTFSVQTKLIYPTALQTTPLVTASGTNNTDFTVQRAGWYTISAGGRYGNQSSEGYWAIRRGTTEVKGQNYPVRTFGVASVTETLYCAVGDSFNFALSPTVSVTTAPTFEVQSFSMKYLGD